MEKRKKTWTKRPPAVTAVALAIVILFIIRLYQVAEPLVQSHLLEGGISGPLFSGMALTPLGGTVATGASYLLLSLAGVIVLIAFLRLHRWSWVVLMAWTAVSLTISLIEIQQGSEPNWVVMASNTIIAVALNQSEVQHIFGIRRDDGQDLQ